MDRGRTMMMTPANAHRLRQNLPPMPIVVPNLLVLVTSGAIIALRSLLSTPACVTSVLFACSLHVLLSTGVNATAASAALPRVLDGRFGRGGGVSYVLPTSSSAFVVSHSARAHPPPPPRSSRILATAPSQFPGVAGVVGADAGTEIARERNGRGRHDEDRNNNDDEGAKETTDWTNPAGARVSVRRADPDEVRYLSSVVAECFATASPAVASDDLRSKSYRRSNDLLASIIAAAVERFVLRWMVFAGMIERLVRSSFAAGYAEGSGGGADGDGGGPAGLFVAEVVDVDADANTTTSSSSSSPSVVVGVVELAPPGPCPVPLGLASTAGRTKDEQRNVPFVCNLAVRDGHRNLGVGRSLLRRCEAECRRDGGSSEVWLETLSTNVAALRLYQSEGFVCEGVDPECGSGARRSSFRRVYMRKRLTNDSPEYYGGRGVGASAGAGAGTGAGGRDDDVLLRIAPQAEAEGGGWTAEFDVDGGTPSCIIEPTFAERYLGGVLGPALVAVAGVLIGLPVRLSRITR